MASLLVADRPRGARRVLPEADADLACAALGLAGCEVRGAVRAQDPEGSELCLGGAESCDRLVDRLLGRPESAREAGEATRDAETVLLLAELDVVRGESRERELGEKLLEGTSFE